MNLDWEAIAFLLFFVIAPVIRWLAERFTKAREQARKTPPRNPWAGREESRDPDARRRATSEAQDELEEIPPWFENEPDWQEQPAGDLEPVTPIEPEEFRDLEDHGDFRGPRRSTADSPRPVVFTVAPQGTRTTPPPIRSRSTILDPTEDIHSRREARGRIRPRVGLAQVGGRSELRKAVLYAEILGPPRAIHPHDSDR